MDRFTAAIVAGVLGLVIIGVAVAVLMRGREAAPDLSTPAGVALAYELALQRGDPERAWELLAASVRAENSRDQFLMRTGGRYPYNERSRLSIDTEEMSGETARVELSRTSPAARGPFDLGGSYSERLVLRLVREDGQWRITLPPEPYPLKGVTVPSPPPPSGP